MHAGICFTISKCVRRNPHADLQAQARAHRLGQTRAVMIYRCAALLGAFLCPSLSNGIWCGESLTIHSRGTLEPILTARACLLLCTTATHHACHPLSPLQCNYMSRDTARPPTSFPLQTPIPPRTVRPVRAEQSTLPFASICTTLT